MQPYLSLESSKIWWFASSRHPRKLFLYFNQLILIVLVVEQKLWCLSINDTYFIFCAPPRLIFSWFEYKKVPGYSDDNQMMKNTFKLPCLIYPGFFLDYMILFRCSQILVSVYTSLQLQAYMLCWCGSGSAVILDDLILFDLLFFFLNLPCTSWTCSCSSCSS